MSLARISYVTSPSRQIISNKEYSWNYPHGTYGMMSYNKTAVILYTLMGIIGEDTMNDIFREYYRKWAFRHPSGKDFIDIVNEVVIRQHGDKYGKDMNWFFDQTLFGTGICDYKVSNIQNSRIDFPSQDSVKSESVIDPGSIGDTVFRSKVQLERVGEVMLPEEILVHFSNGDEVLEKWDGKSRVMDFTYTGKNKVEWVKIDPDFKIKLDVNYINNSITLSPDMIPVRRITDKLLSFMQFFLSFISL